MAKVAITANTSWYIYNFRKNTIRSLIESGHEVVAISPLDAYSSKLVGLGCKHVNVYIDQGGTNPIKDVYCFLYFLKIYIDNDIDIVLNFTPKNNIYNTLAASLRKIKCVNNIAGLGFVFGKKNIMSFIVRFLYRVSQKRASKIFFQNEDDRILFLNNKIAAGVICDRLPGSGVDLGRFVYTSAHDDGKVRFLLAARMIHEKGVALYVDAARVLKEKHGDKVELFLLGFLDTDNPSSVTREEMRGWVAEGVVIYLGVSDDVEREIAKMDCVVLPSYYREGVPKILLEAGAMGKPIITTDNVGCREVVEDGVNGFLCIPGSTDSLIEKMEKIIGMPHEQRLVMGENGRKKIMKEFDERIVIEKYIETVESMCS